MSVPFLGEIRIFAGSYAPANWHFCDGTQLDIAAYNALYALVGTTYGGDGITKFALPNLTGRVPIGQGAGAGLTVRNPGGAGGSDQVTLAEAQLPLHGHSMQGVTAAATAPTPGPAVTFGQIPSNSQFYNVLPTGTPATSPYSAQSIHASGASQPHPNLMPYLALNYIICIQAGLFPERN